jgi:phosphoglycerate dehydrogenase-like enzyme
MPTPLIAVSDEFHGMLQDHARKRGVAVNMARVGLDDVSGIEAVLASGIRTPDLRQLLREHPGVRWLAVQSAGVDNVMLPEVLERNIAVTRVRHVHDAYVSEFAMTQVLVASKRIAELVTAKERREWLGFQPPLVAGKTLSIVGYGEIGRALARKAKSFDMRVIGVRAHPRADDYADMVWGVDRLDDAFGEADFVVLAVPGGGGRKQLIGERQLRLLKPEAYLANVGRGEVVDEAALDRVLREGGFAGALIDTFAVEPLPQDSPLWTNPRVFISPHIAGVRGGPTGEAVLDQLVENMDHFAKGEPLINQVDTGQGY